MLTARPVYPAGGPLFDSQTYSSPDTPMATTYASSSPSPGAATNSAPRVRDRLARRLSLTASSVVHSVTSSSLFGSSPPPASSSSLYQQPQFYRGSSTVLGRSGTNASSAGVPSASPVAQAASASTSSLPSQRRNRSTSQPPPPPKYRTYRTPQLRISLQDSHGNLVLSPPVMAPGESIRGQIHLELPKPTPVHSIEVSLTGTVSAYDGARLGVMKSETILEEIKTVATASMTNARTNTTRRHTAPAAPPTAPSSRSAVTAAGGAPPADTTTREHRRSSVTSMASPRARSPNPAVNNNAISQRASLTSELMSRTLSTPSSHYTHGLNASTHSLNRPISPTMHDIRGRRTSFSANIDVAGSSPGSYPGPGSGFQLFGRSNMSAVNISTISQWSDSVYEDSTPVYAPSYDSPNFEHLFTGTSATSSAPSAPRHSDEINPNMETTATASSASSIPEEEESETSSSNIDSSLSSSSSSAITTTTAATSVSIASSSVPRRSASRPMTRSSSSSGTNGSTSSSRGGNSSTGSAVTADDTTVATTTAVVSSAPAISSAVAATTAEPDQDLGSTLPVQGSEPVPSEPEPEPKAVLMQPGNYVIPFSIRIPSNSAMSLPGSFSDPVGHISYQLRAIMKQIIPPTNDGPRAPPRPIKVEPTYTSAAQVIKLIPMNDPQRMPFYTVPFETPTLKAGVGHWVWSTGFVEARAWIPKQCFRPGRMVPLVIYIVNHSDAKQVVVETTLCKCLHYGSGLTKLREMAEQGVLPPQSTMDWEGGSQEDDATPHSYYSSSSSMGPISNNTLPSPPSELVTAASSTSRWDRSRLSLLRSPSRTSRHRQRTQQETMPSPPASPSANEFSSGTPSSDRSRSPEGSLYGYSSATMPASPSMMNSTSMGSLSSQLESLAASSPSLPPSATAGGGGVSTLPAKPLGTLLPQVQHQREKLVKLRTSIGCHQAIDREIQKTIMVPIPATAGYSILNAPLLEVSYEIVIKVRVDKAYSRGIRLEVPIVVVVPEEGDMEEEEGLMLDAGVDYQAMLSMTDLHGGAAGGYHANGARGRTGAGTGGESTATLDSHARYGFSLDDDYGECPPYEPPPVSSGRRRSRR